MWFPRKFGKINKMCVWHDTKLLGQPISILPPRVLILHCNLQTCLGSVFPTKNYFVSFIHSDIFLTISLSTSHSQYIILPSPNRMFHTYKVYFLKSCSIILTKYPRLKQLSNVYSTRCHIYGDNFRICCFNCNVSRHIYHCNFFWK